MSTGLAGRRLATAAGGELTIDEVRVADVLVVGTGVAGLVTALGCAGRTVTVLTKTRLGEGGSSARAQGGVAAAVGSDDSPALHAADTVAVAGGLADPWMVELLAGEGPARVAELMRLGTRFDREATDGGDTRGGHGRLALGREAAHSRRRILHAGGDATGRELVRALVAALDRAPWVRVEEECFAVDLVLEPAAGGGSALGERPRRVAGVLALDAAGRRVLQLAGATVLATGGAGQLYLHTTNPPEVTGDGVAMAARAGARLADLEFVQFHPTALAVDEGGEGCLTLLTEALRGEGAVLVDGAGRRFMPSEHPLAELAPRDVVARAIHRRHAAGEPVFLDARAALGDRLPERFPTVFRAARAAGLDPRRQPLPVVPAAHYHMGGVVTDDRGRTTLAGLWACGETATTGVHGANRLASNSLLEALVFGARVAGDLARRLTAVPGSGREDLARLEVAGDLGTPGAEAHPAAAEPDALAAAAARRRLQVRMWKDVGLVRDAAGLGRAAAELARLAVEVRQLVAESTGSADPGLLRDLLETRNLVTVGRLVTAAALLRRESRGAHHRRDHPGEEEPWRRRVLVTCGAAEMPVLTLSEPIGDGAAAVAGVADPSGRRAAAGGTGAGAGAAPAAVPDRRGSRRLG